MANRGLMNTFTKQFKKIDLKKSPDEFHVANNIMKNSFLIGCNHGLNDDHIKKIEHTFLSFLQKI